MFGILKTRYLHFLLFYLPFLSCTPSNLARVSERRSDIILLDSYYEQNTPGYRTAPKSVEYYFKIKVTSNNRIEFDSVWINDKRYALFVSRLVGPISNEEFILKKKDSAMVRASTFSVSDSIVPPIAYDGKALIRFYEGGQKNILLLRSFH